MKIELIKELMNEFKGSDLTKLKLSHEGFSLELEREKEVVQAMPIATTTNLQQPVFTPAPTTHQILEEVGEVLAAPMVGTFYESLAPGTPPFVTVGSKVKKGQVVGIIEAMKLMNEVEADRDGEIVAILVENEAMVEFNQPLFKIK